MFRAKLFLAVSVCGFIAIKTHAADFRGIGFVPGEKLFSEAAAVSADGRVVVGHSRPTDASEHAVRWTRGGGIQYIGDLPGGETRSWAFDVSADGMYIVGKGRVSTGDEAYRWSHAGGMQGLGFLSDVDKRSTAEANSADGSVVVGFSTNYDPQLGLYTEAFRWTESGGMAGLGDLPGDIVYSQAADVSADGTIVVGYSNSALGAEAFRWTEAEGMTSIGVLPGGLHDSGAGAISADGRFIVGGSSSEIGQEAYRWDANEGMIPLGTLPSFDDFSVAFGVSDSGVVVGGSAGADFDYRAFIWTEDDGLRDLRDVLVSDYGLGDQLTGWTLQVANDITPDGRTIVGYGINPDGNTEGWVFTVPEPATLPMAIIVAAIALLVTPLTRRKCA